jgi:predicted TPR repeat methyltransferase
MTATASDKSALLPEPLSTSESDEYAAVAAFFDEFAAVDDRWRRRNRTYHELIESIYRFHIPPGSRVIEIGCGAGDLLAALEPSVGLGIDVSEGMVAEARRRHPQLEFAVGAGEAFATDETFDYVVISDLVPFASDLVTLFRRVAALSNERTRVIVNSYNQLWRPVIRLAERLRLKPRKPIRNWVSPDDVRNVLGLAGLEVVTTQRRILMPKRIPIITTLLNGFVASLWPFNRLCLSYWITARLEPREPRELSVSVICPCRNEEGHIGGIIERLPELGRETELVFVEGGSRDGTRAEIERQIAHHPDRDISLVAQTGSGKGDAVRAGFAHAKHDVLMILDGDLSVSPEDLPKFYRALAEGRAELVNGSRLVYDLEPGSMRLLNVIGNKIFSRIFESVLGQPVKDTLCGTKVLHRADYAKIAAGRSYFGDFDPFGDFDLLFGAGRLGLRIVDLPVRYHPRAYGQTNIKRFSHGLLLLRMTLFAFWKFRVSLLRPRRV